MYSVLLVKGQKMVFRHQSMDISEALHRLFIVL